MLLFQLLKEQRPGKAGLLNTAKDLWTRYLLLLLHLPGACMLLFKVLKIDISLNLLLLHLLQLQLVVKAATAKWEAAERGAGAMKIIADINNFLNDKFDVEHDDKVLVL